MTSNEEQSTRVRAQYAADSGATFYKFVMGDGGADIHYGIYETPATSMRDATKASTLRLLALVENARHGEPIKEIVDIGAGAGGTAHVVAALRDVHFTCVDLCEHLNRENRRRAAELGLAGKIETWTGSFDRLPADWSSRFDVVWSQDAICHAADKRAVFAEAHRVLRPGGVLVFSDILLADNAPIDEAKAFTDVNAVVQLATLGEYERDLARAGFMETRHEDWTEHLAANFAHMLGQINRQSRELIRAGVPAEHLDRFANSLARRLSWPRGAVMRWGAFACRKAANQG